MEVKALDESNRVILAYQQHRESGADEWTAFDAALESFRTRHPEASAEFAHHYVADLLSDLGQSSATEW